MPVDQHDVLVAEHPGVVAGAGRLARQGRRRTRSRRPSGSGSSRGRGTGSGAPRHPSAGDRPDVPDQRQPGSRTRRPMWPPPISTSSMRPSNLTDLVGGSRTWCSACGMTASRLVCDRGPSRQRRRRPTRPAPRARQTGLIHISLDTYTVCSGAEPRRAAKAEPGPGWWTPPSGCSSSRASTPPRSSRSPPRPATRRAPSTRIRLEGGPVLRRLRAACRPLRWVESNAA